MNPSPQRCIQLAEGERLGPYQIESHLADGGMGKVYRARDTRLGRAVAIKFANHEFGARFEREVRAISSINHPHICTVYDVGPQYLVMELVEGETLAARIARSGASGLPVADVLRWGAEIADALAEAHSKNITHRDLKPGNVMIGRSGVKVLDFGLAKWTAEDAVVGPDSDTRSLECPDGDALTRPGSTIGTAAYMSPEQARGEGLDARTDIFSLGVVLYEMATGQRPFRGVSQAEIFAGILKGEPAPPASLNPAVSPELSRIILRALEKDRELRFQSAADLRSELTRLMHVSAQSAGQPSPSSGAVPVRSRRGVYAIAAAALAAACAGGYLLSRSNSSDPWGAGGSAVKLTQITDSGHLQKGSAISPDGRYFAYAESSRLDTNLYVRQLAGGNPIRILGPEKATMHVTFSPDSTSLFVVKIDQAGTGTLYQMPVLGGAPRKLLSKIDSEVAFSPDGRKIVFTRTEPWPSPGNSSVVVANVDGSGENSIYTRPQCCYFHQAAWSSDGNTVAVSTAGNPVLVPVNGGAPREFTVPGWRAIINLTWLKSGRGFLLAAEDIAAGFTAGHQILEVTWPNAGAISGAAPRVVRLTNDLNDHHSLSATADLSSLTVVDIGAASNIWVAPPGHPDQAEPINGGRSQGSFGVAWSADGRLIFSDIASAGWVMNADGSSLRPFTADKRTVRVPALCGPGPLFAFVGGQNSGAGEFYVGDPDGAAPRKLAEGLFRSSCTPNGQWLVYSNVKNEIWKVPIGGGQAVRLFENSRDPIPSKDGKWMSLIRMDPKGGPQKLEVKSMTGAEDAKLADIGSGIPEYKWNPDGTGLTVIERGDRADNLWNVPLGGAPATAITHFTSESIFGLAWSADGRLALARGHGTADAVLIQRK